MKTAIEYAGLDELLTEGGDDSRLL